MAGQLIGRTTTAEPELCASCGRRLAAGRCLRCGRTLAGIVHREFVVLAVLCLAGAVAFVATRALAQLHERWREHDAVTWFSRGQDALAARRAGDAVAALRRAASLEHQRPEYQLMLARALESDGQADAARRVLLDLREATPEDPGINSRLAAVEAARGDETAAIRYYQNALYGVWSEDSRSERQALRLRFIRYLLDHRHESRALSELVAVEQQVDPAAATQTVLGELFLRADDPVRALRHFRTAIAAGISDRARAGAGIAAYRLGDYRAAVDALAALRDADPEISRVRATALLVLAHDPLLPRLAAEERRRRAAIDVAIARGRLAACPAAASTPLASADLERVAADIAASRMHVPIETMDDVVEWIGRAERASEACGRALPVDDALTAIAARRRAEAP